MNFLYFINIYIDKRFKNNKNNAYESYIFKKNLLCVQVQETNLSFGMFQNITTNIH